MYRQIRPLGAGMTRRKGKKRAAQLGPPLIIFGKPQIPPKPEIPKSEPNA